MLMIGFQTGSECRRTPGYCMPFRHFLSKDGMNETEDRKRLLRNFGIGESFLLNRNESSARKAMLFRGGTV